MKTCISLLLLICSFPFWGVGQSLNGDFEQWSDTLYSMQYFVPAQDPLRGLPDDWEWNGTLPGGVCRVSDATSGSYAVCCYTFYNYIAGSMRYRSVQSDRPLSLRGSYRYLLGDADYEDALRYGEVWLWADGDTIGQGRIDFDTTSAYTQFELTINYTSTAEPDSLLLVFHTNGYGSADMSSGFLFLDELKWSFLTDGIGEIDEALFRVYPNPVSGAIRLQWMGTGVLSYTIRDLSGRNLQRNSMRPGIQVIRLDEYARGNYLLMLTDETGRMAKHQISLE